jgi:glutamine synthetase
MTTNTRGMLSIEQLAHAVKNETIETVLVAFTGLYGRFLGKRIDAEFFLDTVVNNGVGACNYLLTVDMDMMPVAGYEFSNWKKGYGDFYLMPDFSTMRTASWLDKTAIVIADVIHEKTRELIPMAPRSLLKNQLNQLAELKLTAKAASELEYFTMKNTYDEARQKHYADLTPYGSYIEDYHVTQCTREEALHGALRYHLKHSGIPVETSKGEWGLGQHEMNVRYEDALLMADRHCLLKQCTKDVADQQALSTTFMAKPFEDQAGSSCHIHFSLWDLKNNAFAGDKDLSGIASSDIFRWFLGGWIKHTPEFMVFYAPTINSYKRYQSESWAPTGLAWSHDNRTAGFRIVGHGQSLRIECRLPGADINPYLAYTAALASGLDGIANKIEPPEHFSGDAYHDEQIDRLPVTLEQAVKLFEASDFVRSVLGEDVAKHYAHFYRNEVKAFDRAVTDWERKRYYEQI